MIRLDHSLLIARREFLDHVRTRGFWFSLATVPLILLVSIAIPTAAELARPTLTFAVTDESGWLLPALVRSADADDLARLLTSGEATPAPLEALASTLRDQPRGRAARRIETILERAGDAEGTDLDDANDTNDTNDNDAAPGDSGEAALLDWWNTLTAAERRRLMPWSWRDRFPLAHAPQRWTPAFEARANLAAERIFAWVQIPEDPVGSVTSPAEPLRYTAANLTNRDLRDWLTARFDALLTRARLAEGGMDEHRYAWVAAGADVEVHTLAARGEESSADTGDVLRQWGPVAFVYILWISIQVVAQMLLSSTVEEKSNKLVEILLATVEPLPVMAGKLLGIAAIGAVLVSTWVGTFVIATIGLPLLLGAGADLDLLALATDPVYLASFLAYYLLGYAFYGALLVGLGALCTTLKEAQTLAIPVQSMLFVPLLAMVPIARDPNGTLAAVLTWLPPFTPFVMMNRAAQPPDASVYVGTTVLMLAAIAGALWLSARLFRSGVLMTGQAPGFRAMIGLLRTSTAQRPEAAAREQ